MYRHIVTVETHFCGTERDEGVHLPPVKDDINFSFFFSFIDNYMKVCKSILLYIVYISYRLFPIETHQSKRCIRENLVYLSLEIIDLP